MAIAVYTLHLTVCAIAIILLHDKLINQSAAYYMPPIRISSHDQNTDDQPTPTPMPTSQPQPHPQCTWSPDPGPCRAFFRRYYYNFQTQSCEAFVYGGCGGLVPFRTSVQCEMAHCNLLASNLGLGYLPNPADHHTTWRVVSLTAETVIDY